MNERLTAARRRHELAAAALKARAADPTATTADILTAAVEEDCAYRNMMIVHYAVEEAAAIEAARLSAAADNMHSAYSAFVSAIEATAAADKALKIAQESGDLSAELTAGRVYCDAYCAEETARTNSRIARREYAKLADRAAAEATAAEAAANLIARHTAEGLHHRAEARCANMRAAATLHTADKAAYRATAYAHHKEARKHEAAAAAATAAESRRSTGCLSYNNPTEAAATAYRATS